MISAGGRRAVGTIFLLFAEGVENFFTSSRRNFEHRAAAKVTRITANARRSVQVAFPVSHERAAWQRSIAAGTAGRAECVEDRFRAGGIDLENDAAGAAAIVITSGRRHAVEVSRGVHHESGSRFRSIAARPLTSRALECVDYAFRAIGRDFEHGAATVVAIGSSASVKRCSVEIARLVHDETAIRLAAVAATRLGKAVEETLLVVCGDLEDGAAAVAGVERCCSVEISGPVPDHAGSRVRAVGAPLKCVERRFGALCRRKRRGQHEHDNTGRKRTSHLNCPRPGFGDRHCESSFGRSEARADVTAAHPPFGGGVNYFWGVARIGQD